MPILSFVTDYENILNIELHTCVTYLCYLVMKKHTSSQVQGHLIHQFLEDPLMSLSVLKDDDRLTAYKIPKLMTNARYLQLVHRREGP